MSLGLGIFLSVVLLIAVWQIDKRGAWRKFGKFFGWSLGALALVGAAIGAYVWWDNYSGDALLKRQRHMMVNGEITEYDGITLGMTQDQVLYLKGKPTSELEVESDDSDEAWMWGEFSTTHTMIFWRKDDTVDTIMCDSDGVVDCAPIVGLETGDSEASVLAALGEPKAAPSYTKDGEKMLVYGPKSAEWHFSFKQKRLQGIFVDSTATDAAQVAPTKDDSQRPLTK
jgi:hypothetical protein